VGSAGEGHEDQLGRFFGAVCVAQLPPALGKDCVDVSFHQLPECLG